ncbi:MAG: hypothetical protein ACRDIE_21255 [Chloroflexota bacterium]
MMEQRQSLDIYLPESIRAHLEQTYYARVNAQATLEHVLQDADFRRDPPRHVALYTDHGVVHVRDVATQILQVLDTINGVLIPARVPTQLELMKGYGVMVAYLHDIGMADFSHFGRAMHPEYAAQAAFEPAFDAIVGTLWEENWSNIAWRLLNLARTGALEQPPELVLREMLAMSNGHSKSKVPAAVLNDSGLLRRVMLRTISTELSVLYQRTQAEKAARLRGTTQQGAGQIGLPYSALIHAEARPEDLADSASITEQAERRATVLRRFYADVERDAFGWLVSEHAAVRALVQDVVDTLRALRCADALRQRGTVMKTSGNYEVFVDRITAYPIYALRKGNGQLLLLTLPNPISGGEANIAGSELARDGSLRISFHRGAFANHEIVERSVRDVADVIHDIKRDVHESFARRAQPGGERDADLKRADTLLILLEEVDDNLEYATLVRDRLQHLAPELRGRVRTVPSLQQAPAVERARYLEADELDWDDTARQDLLRRMAGAGHKTAPIDPVAAFDGVRRLTLRAGETLIEAGAPAGFVYVPLGEGLTIIPLGGYQSFAVAPWMPVGNTGVIRGAVRNATVVTGRDITLLMIPKEVYLRRWHYPYTAAELLQRVARPTEEMDDPPSSI